MHHRSRQVQSKKCKNLQRAWICASEQFKCSVSPLQSQKTNNLSEINHILTHCKIVAVLYRTKVNLKSFVHKNPDLPARC